MMMMMMMMMLMMIFTLFYYITFNTVWNVLCECNEAYTLDRVETRRE